MILQLALFSLLIIIHHSAFALPRSLSGRQAGRTFNTTQSQIQAVVRDHNGVDITSSFHIMLYQDQKPHQNNSLSDRQLSTRPINNCGVPNSYFRSSQCTPLEGVAGSLQRWRIYCHLPYDIPDPVTRATQTFWVASNTHGRCEDHEICVDALDFNAYNQLTHVARCVSQEDYVFVDEPRHSNPKIEFGGRRANVMVSKSDKETPLEVDSFTVQAGTIKELGQSKKCRDCIELRTDTFQPDTERLKTEVKLLTTGAMTGILLLSLISG